MAADATEKAKARSMGNVSDIMSGLMMIFLFISITYMLDVKSKAIGLSDTKNRKEGSEQNNTYQLWLHRALDSTFSSHYEKWNMSLDSNNTIKFHNPEFLFEQGSAVIKPKFQEILDEFFPKYLSVLTNPLFISEIQEVRVEGHTSSLWLNENHKKYNFLKNIKLSQNRAYAVVEYGMNIEQIEDKVPWLFDVIRAYGLSSSRKIIDENASENLIASRRVEFKVTTKQYVDAP